MKRFFETQALNLNRFLAAGVVIACLIEFTPTGISQAKVASLHLSRQKILRQSIDTAYPDRNGLFSCGETPHFMSVYFAGKKTFYLNHVITGYLF